MSAARTTGRRVLAWLQDSLQARAVATTLLLALVILGLVSAGLSRVVRDGIVDRRVDALLTEAARSVSTAQSTFSASTAASATQVQQLINDTTISLQAGGSADQAVFLWHALGEPSGTVLVNDVATDPDLSSVISSDLREAVVGSSDGQFWQYVDLPIGESDSAPGVAVGSRVTVPLAGTFELYMVFSLAPEATTLSFVSRVLAAAAGLMALSIAVISGLVARQVVRPVTRVSASAKRLAEGHLDERVPVRGHDEVAVLSQSFNAMAASLEEQIERLATLSTVQRRFVSDVSHELRTPLTTIRMASEVIYAEREDFSAPARRSAELLDDQLDRFEALLADLLEISRFDAGAAVLEAERRDMRSIVSAAVDAARPLADRKGVPLVVDLGTNDATADLDAVRIQRIIRNLVVNAIEHAEGGPVEITVAADDRAVAVRVRDYGVGLSKEEAAHVFDRFWRADPARARTTGGTGLGLSIAAEDAALHGGWLEVWGRPRQGASFRLTVPRRAGIVLESSPLDLVPPRPTELPRRRRSTAGVDPSDVPDVSTLEGS